MSAPLKPPIALRIKLPFATEEEFLARYGQNLGRGAMFIATRGIKPEGTVVAFELVLAGGQRVLAGEGVVVRARVDEGGARAGMTVRFTRLEAEGRALLDRAIVKREAAGAGVGPERAEPRPSAPASPDTRVTPQPTSSIPPPRKLPGNPALANDGPGTEPGEVVPPLPRGRDATATRSPAPPPLVGTSRGATAHREPGLTSPPLPSQSGAPESATPEVRRMASGWPQPHFSDDPEPDGFATPSGSNGRSASAAVSTRVDRRFALEETERRALRDARVIPELGSVEAAPVPEERSATRAPHAAPLSEPASRPEPRTQVPLEGASREPSGHSADGEATRRPPEIAAGSLAMTSAPPTSEDEAATATNLSASVRAAAGTEPRSDVVLTSAASGSVALEADTGDSVVAIGSEPPQDETPAASFDVDAQSEPRADTDSATGVNAPATSEEGGSTERAATQIVHDGAARDAAAIQSAESPLSLRDDAAAEGSSGGAVAPLSYDDPDRTEETAPSAESAQTPLREDAAAEEAFTPLSYDDPDHTEETAPSAESAQPPLGEDAAAEGITGGAVSPLSYDGPERTNETAPLAESTQPTLREDSEAQGLIGSPVAPISYDDRADETEAPAESMQPPLREDAEAQGLIGGPVAPVSYDDRSDETAPSVESAQPPLREDAPAEGLTGGAVAPISYDDPPRSDETASSAESPLSLREDVAGQRPDPPLRLVPRPPPREAATAQEMGAPAELPPPARVVSTAASSSRDRLRALLEVRDTTAAGTTSMREIVGIDLGASEVRLQGAGDGSPTDSLDVLDLDALAATLRRRSKQVRCVLALPAGAGAARRHAIAEPLTRGGIELRRLLHATSAAGLSFASTRALARQRVLVIDWGAEKLELALQAITGEDLEVLALQSVSGIGLNPLDLALAEALAPGRRDPGLLAASRAARLRLDDGSETATPVEGLDVPLGRALLERVSAPFLARAKEAISSLLETGRLAPASLDARVAVGWPAHAAWVRAGLAPTTGGSLEPLRPDAVAHGAALFARALEERDAGKPAARISELLGAPIGLLQANGSLLRVFEAGTRLPAQKAIPVAVSAGVPVGLHWFDGERPSEQGWIGGALLEPRQTGEAEAFLSLAAGGLLELSVRLPGADRTPLAFTRPGVWTDALAHAPAPPPRDDAPTSLWSRLRRLGRNR